MRITATVLLASILSACASPQQLTMIPPVSPPKHCQDAAAEHIGLLRQAGVSDERIELLLVSPAGMQQQRPFMEDQGGHVSVVVDGVAVFDNGALRWCHTSGLEPGDEEDHLSRTNRFRIRYAPRCSLDEAIHGITANNWTLKSLSVVEATGGLLAEPWGNQAVAETRP